MVAGARRGRPGWMGGNRLGGAALSAAARGALCAGRLRQAGRAPAASERGGSCAPQAPRLACADLATCRGAAPAIAPPAAREAAGAGAAGGASTAAGPGGGEGHRAGRVGGRAAAHACGGRRGPCCRRRRGCGTGRAEQQRRRQARVARLDAGGRRRRRGGRGGAHAGADTARPANVLPRPTAARGRLPCRAPPPLRCSPGCCLLGAAPAAAQRPALFCRGRQAAGWAQLQQLGTAAVAACSRPLAARPAGLIAAPLRPPVAAQGGMQGWTHCAS